MALKTNIETVTTDAPCRADGSELGDWAREQVAALQPFTAPEIHQAAMLARKLDERIALSPATTGA